MSVDTMIPSKGPSLPAISQRRSSSLRDRSRVTVRFSGAHSHSQSGTGSSGKSSSRSDSTVSDCNDNRTGPISSELYTNGGLNQQFRQHMEKTGSDPTPAQSLHFLPRLVDDQSFVPSAAVANRAKERSTFSSRSLEILPSRDLISEELRMRTVSLPSLRDHHKNIGAVARRTPHLSEEEEMSDGYTDDSSDEDSPIVGIDPFPNVDAESYLSSQLLPDFLPPYLRPWTPGVRKTRPKRNRRNKEAERKRKEMEALAAQQRKRNAQNKSRRQRRSVRSDAFARKRESEVAKRFPVRKQFVYSELVQVELQKLTPKRLPGGKLKPIYNRRTQEGEIDIPKELHISLDSLSLKPGEERGDFSDSPAAINKRRKQELQALLERRKKIQRQMVHKKKRKVHFLLPEEHLKDEVIVQVNAEGSTQNVGESTSPGHSIEDETGQEGQAQKDGELEGVANQSDSRKLGEVVDGDIFDDGKEYRIDRTNSWVANHTAKQTLESSLDSKPGEDDDGVISTSQQPPENIETAFQTNSNDPVHLANGSQTQPLAPSQTKNTNSSIQLDRSIGEPLEMRDSSYSKQRLLSVDEDATQAGQLNRLPGIRPISPLRETDGVLVDSPLMTESGAVREIKFLSERLPSIIISDT